MKEPQIIKQGEEIVVFRKTQGHYENGHYDEGKKCEFKINASVQPLTGYETLQVAEGNRTKEHLNILTHFKMQVNDLINRNSREYEVQNVEDWDSFVKARVVLKDANTKV